MPALSPGKPRARRRATSVVLTVVGLALATPTAVLTGDTPHVGCRLSDAQPPVNPPSAPGLARVSISLGVDGDGFGNCRVSFVQSSAAGDVYEADVIAETNSERTRRGRLALSADACVDSFAEAQSRAMAIQDRMFHQDLSPILRDCQLGAVGENVAFGYPDAKAVTAAWLASPGHRANLLNPRYRLIGVGATRSSQGQWYVSQVFGSHH